MNCIGFPKIFKNKTSTIVLKGGEATTECIHLLLSSEIKTLFGDPEFGIKLKHYVFNQNNYILRDILIDEIYTKLSTFCPQLYIERKNITITQDGSKVYVEISCKNREDYTNNTYDLVLFEGE